jgi:hypothetical protein
MVRRPHPQTPSAIRKIIFLLALFPFSVGAVAQLYSNEPLITTATHQIVMNDYWGTPVTWLPVQTGVNKRSLAFIRG